MTLLISPKLLNPVPDFEHIPDFISKMLHTKQIQEYYTCYAQFQINQIIQTDVIRELIFESV